MAGHVIHEKKVFTEEKEKFKKCELSPSHGQTIKTITVVNLSRGGFLNYFYRPPYQSNMVQTFLDTLGDRMCTSLFRWVLLGESPLDSADILDP